MKILSHFFKILSWYWFKKDSLSAWVMLALTLGFSLAIIKVSVLINLWNKEFYDALSEFKQELILPLVGEFLLYTALIVLFVVCGNWFKKLLVIKWRENLSANLEEMWIKNANFYHLNFGKTIDNPDQRIAEDSLLLTQKSVDLVKSLVYNVAKLVAFIAILWEVSKVIKFELFGVHFEMEGFLFYVALVYTLLCSLATHFIGRSLRGLNFDRQQLEADYRSSLISVRENAEAVAFLRGGELEKGRFRDKFANIMANWRAIMATEFRLECFSASYLRITNLIPIFACLPLYFARVMSFGDMMQARSAFYSVQDGFAWFMDYYKQIMEWAASVERVWGFAQVVKTNEAEQNFSVETKLSGRNLGVATPHGEILANGINFSLNLGQWLRLNGKSGVGKSTLMRYIAGIWSFGWGEVDMPKHGVLFIPQKPYLSQMSLKELIAYPKILTDTNYDEAKFKEILERVGLAKFAKDLDKNDNWAKILSGGEAQRLNFARIYFLKPDFVLMDEATSALDEESAYLLMQNLRSDFPKTGVLAVLHQESLCGLFDSEISVKK